MSSALPARKPWPMKWIILAIVLFVIGYTYLTLHYRKPGPEYEPYADMKKRANTGRLLAAGYRRVVLTVEQPAVPVARTNTAMPAPGGVPDLLAKTIVSRPLLPLQILDVHAAGGGAAAAPYVIDFRCTAPDDKQQLGGAELYVRGNELVITPDFARLTGGLEARTRDNFVTLTIPGGTLPAGAYRVTLVGEQQSRTWRVTLR